MSDPSLRPGHILPTGTVTFLFTDIEGSTKLWERWPDGMKIALARYNSILRQTIEAHGGYVFKTVGDAVCASFATAPDALSAALAAQRALFAETWGETGPLRVRIALHTGTVEEHGGDYFGPPLNRVARLSSAGHGGQTLLSLATEELVRDHLPSGIVLRDLGEHRLKDLVRPERIFQLVAPDLPTDFPPLKSLDAIPNNLPIQLTSFIGREREMAQVKQLLSLTRLLTLTGSGGCGKTRLSLQVAADLLDTFADGVWLIELAPLSDPMLVPQTAASTLGVREEPGRPIVETLSDYLQPRQLLLVLDNCEHVVAACAQLAQALLHTCPDLKILATSREALGIAGEIAWRVPSLSLPDLRRQPLVETDLVSTLTQYEAVRLFIDRAVAVLPAFTVTNRNAPAVAQICYRLDGIPLAIELAAARVKVLSVEQINARLDDRFRLLTGGNRTALPRQQTLRALIDWSYDLLSEVERMLLRRLSVFAGGFTLEAAEAVCAGEGVEEYEVLDLLSQLVNKSLVTVEEQRGEARYQLLETIRQYGGEKLQAAGEMVELRKRHRDWYLGLVERAELELQGPNQGVWLDRLETEHDNLRLVLEGSRTEEGGAEGALQLVGVLWRFWYVRGHLSEGRKWLETTLSGSRVVSVSARAKALNGAGILAYSQGDCTSASTLLEESLTIYRELGDKLGIANVLTNLGLVAYRQGNYTSARALLEESLEIRRELEDKRGIASSLGNLGLVAREQGNYTLARSLHEESLRIRRELGDKLGIAYSLGDLGNVAYCRGDYVSARSLHEESLEIRRELGDKRGIAGSLGNLGLVAREQGNYTLARSLHEESLRIRRELGDKLGIAYSLGDLGNVAYCRGDYVSARSLHEESLEIRRELGDKRGIASSLSSLGCVASHQEDYVSARSFFKESLTIRCTLGNKGGIAECLERLAGIACAQGQAKQAAQLLGAAEALRETIGAFLPPSDRVHYDYCVTAVRAALGKEIFTAAWTEGRAMSLEQAIASALEEIAPAQPSASESA